jgi:hypothetical protein
MLERTLKTFPDWTMPSRSIAEAFAEQAIDKIIVVDQDGHFVNYRILATRIEDDPSGSEKGKVVASCERVDAFTPLTGKDIHTLYCPLNLFAASWDDLSGTSRSAYNTIAAQITTQYLAPLQGLVKDYQALQKQLYHELYENAGDSEEMEIAMRDLNARAAKLVGEN